MEILRISDGKIETVKISIFSKDGIFETQDGKSETSCYLEDCPCYNDTEKQNATAPPFGGAAA